MSSNLSTLQPGKSTLPAAFQGAKMAQAFVGEKIESGAEGIEGGYSILKYAGKVWSLSHRGETRPFIRADDGTARGAVDVIIVKSGTHKAKTYYENFQEGSRDKPLCFSNDGAKPDPSIPNPPSQTCVLCPMNVFGSKITPDGNKAKKCGDHKRTAVVIDPPLAMSVLGVPLDESALLRIPAASLSDFAVYAASMESQGFPLPTVITRISFDMTKNYPKFKFEAIRPLTDVEGELAMAFRNDPLTSRIVSDPSVDAVVMDEDPNNNGGGAVGQAGQVGNRGHQYVGGPAQNPNAQGQHHGVGQGTVTTGPVQTAQHHPNPPVQQTVQQATQNPQHVQAQPSNVVPLEVAPRLTPQQQAAAMTPAVPEGATDFDAELDAEINALLK